MQQLSFLGDMFQEQPADKKDWFQEMLNVLQLEDHAGGWVDVFGAKIRDCLKSLKKEPIKTLSIFSGGGGLDIAFHDCGFQSLQMVEVEERYIKTLEENSKTGGYLSGAEALCVDIRDFYPSKDLEIDFIIGGPPCQTFSAAGRRASGVQGLDDPRGTLFEEYVRLLKTLKPKGFLFENVAGVVGAQKGAAWREIQQAFEAAGYSIFYRILDSADYGVPQHRERLFIVGLRHGEFLFPFPTHGPDAIGTHPFYTAGQAVEGVEVSNVTVGIGGHHGHLLNDIPPGLNYSFYTAKMGHPNPVFAWRSKFSDYLYKADPDMPVRTIKAQGGQYTGPFSWENRVFTLEELKRLQTIPDDYRIVGTRLAAIEQIGNSVPPQIGRILGLSILDQVMGVQLPFDIAYMPPSFELGFRKRKRERTRLYARRAEKAINQKRHGHTSRSLVSIEHEDIFYLGPNFSWSREHSSESHQQYLKFELNEHRWRIGASNQPSSFNEVSFMVNIAPANHQWTLPTQKVELYADDYNTALFTGLWKAFQERLLHITGIADLVQLSGYYQYTPRIQITLECASDDVPILWRLLSKISEGQCIAQQLSEEQFAATLGIDSEDVLTYFQQLRRIGYEIRNNNTNPQIPENHYLIPYAFPTLTPKSVQLHRSLD